MAERLLCWQSWQRGFYVIWLALGQLWTTTRRQPHSPDVNHSFISSSTQRLLGALSRDWSQNQTEHISRVQTRNLPILSVMPYPIVLLSPIGSQSGSTSILKKSLLSFWRKPRLFWNQYPLPVKAIHHVNFSEPINKQVFNYKFIVIKRIHIQPTLNKIDHSIDAQKFQVSQFINA